MTRGDKIRAMSDEDLADILYDSIDPDKYCGCPEDEDCDKNVPCRECLIEWLREEENT